MSHADYSAADSESSKTLRIASLGSSYASGPGIRPVKNKLAMRSRNNYASIVARRMNADLTDLTVSGATLGNVLDEPQTVFFFKKFPPQVKGLPRDVDVVVLTGGGNDLNYDNAIFRDVLKEKFLGRWLQKLIPVPGEGQDMDPETLINKFLLVIDEIRRHSPDCRILLVEYFTLLGPHCEPGTAIGLSAEQIAYHRGVAEKLQSTYEEAARRREGVECVPVRQLSTDHGLGSPEPWLDGFSWSMMFKGHAPFHPKAIGMQKVADMVYDMLKDGPQSGGKAVAEKVKSAAEGGDSSEVQKAVHEDRKLVM